MIDTLPAHGEFDCGQVTGLAQFHGQAGLVR